MCAGLAVVPGRKGILRQRKFQNIHFIVQICNVNGFRCGAPMLSIERNQLFLKGNQLVLFGFHLEGRCNRNKGLCIKEKVVQKKPSIHAKCTIEPKLQPTFLVRAKSIQIGSIA